jgi:hypothetical protein
MTSSASPFLFIEIVVLPVLLGTGIEVYRRSETRGVFWTISLSIATCLMALPAVFLLLPGHRSGYWPASSAGWERGMHAWFLTAFTVAGSFFVSVGVALSQFVRGILSPKKEGIWLSGCYALAGATNAFLVGIFVLENMPME